MNIDATPPFLSNTHIDSHGREGPCLFRHGGDWARSRDVQMIAEAKVGDEFEAPSTVSFRIDRGESGGLRLLCAGGKLRRLGAGEVQARIDMTRVDAAEEFAKSPTDRLQYLLGIAESKYGKDSRSAKAFRREIADRALTRREG